jgi:FkbM family methyltransferase
VSLEHAIQLAVGDPPLFARKCLARATAAVPFFPPRATLRVGDVSFDCDFSLGPKVRDMYFGAYEPEEVDLFRRFVRRGDTVVDAGANIGFFTAVAASLAGPEGEVHAFEPVPAYFQRLVALRAANPRHRFQLNNEALGAEESRAEIRVSGAGNLGWNTLVPELMPRESAAATHEVRVRRLDQYLDEHRVERLALLKVDVEGFELPLLRGFTGWLERRSERPAILCEVAPGAYPPQNARLEDLFSLLARFGYRAFSAAKAERPIAASDLRETTNVLFHA